jgi:hypothetical protein
VCLLQHSNDDARTRVLLPNFLLSYFSTKQFSEDIAIRRRFFQAEPQTSFTHNTLKIGSELINTYLSFC